MLRRIIQTAFGIGVGIMLQLVFPRHSGVNLPITVGLSFVGSVAARLVAERVLPAQDVQMAGFAVTAIGAITLLLAYGVFTT